MPVVHHLPVGGLPLDSELASPRRNRARQVDRGLLQTAVTDLEGRVQPAPPVGAGVAFVAPVNLTTLCALRVFGGPTETCRAWAIRLCALYVFGSPILLLRIRLAGAQGTSEAGHREAGGECLRE